MAEKTIIVCDNCGQTIEKKTEVYQISLKSIASWHDVYDTGYNYIRLDLCQTCGKRLIPTLDAIVKKFGIVASTGES